VLKPVAALILAVVICITAIVLVAVFLQLMGLPPEAAVLLAPLAILVPPTVYMILSTLFSRHPTPGYCAKCGYDLRATPHRCPECGMVPMKSTPRALDASSN
jgi:hypothetical protein